MASPTTGFFETLVAASMDAAANMATKFKNAMIDSIYYGYQPLYNAAIGQTLSIIVPNVNEGNVVDIGASDIQISDTSHSNVTLTLNHKFSDSFIIRNFDQLRTPLDIRQTFLDARMEEVLRKFNRSLCNLVTSGNFNSYTTVTGGNDTFTRSHLADGWNNLAGYGVPTDDPDNLCFLTHNRVYSNMLNEPSLVQQSIVGDAPADASRSAVLLPTFGATLKYDQHFPQPTAATTYSGLFFHRYAIAARAGVEASQADGSIRETVVYPRQSLPVKIQTWNSGDKQGQVVHISLCVGYGVIRPEFGSYFQTT